MYKADLFTVLDEVDSTNNYAMGMCRNGVAKHGSCWYTPHQTKGKGQRGKTWMSEAASNIAMSIVIAPVTVYKGNPFLISALIAVTTCKFLEELSYPSTCNIKWPNDIYINDKKAAGILLETIISGRSWKWCIAGIGINVNQISFTKDLNRATSLKLETGSNFEPETLSRSLHQKILEAIDNFNAEMTTKLIETYNSLLFKKGEVVTLKKETASFQTTINRVDNFGNLHTQDSVGRTFSFGDVEWIL